MSEIWLEEVSSYKLKDISLCCHVCFTIYCLCRLLQMFSVWFRKLERWRVTAIIKKDLFSEHCFYFFISSPPPYVRGTFSFLLSKKEVSSRCSVFLALCVTCLPFLQYMVVVVSETQMLIVILEEKFFVLRLISILSLVSWPIWPKLWKKKYFNSWMPRDWFCFGVFVFLCLGNLMAFSELPYIVIILIVF